MYQPTSEQFGILPVPIGAREEAGLKTWNQAAVSCMKISRSFKYLAQQQGTRLPVLPVHTSAEHVFFAKLMQRHFDGDTFCGDGTAGVSTNSAISRGPAKKEPNYIGMCREFAREAEKPAAEGQKIYYKVSARVFTLQRLCPWLTALAFSPAARELEATLPQV